MVDDNNAARAPQGVKLFGSAVLRVAPDTASIVVAVSQAVKDYTEAIRLEPSNANFYASRAGAHRANGQEQEAAADEGKAKELRK